MVDYTITFARAARKELEALPPPPVQKIMIKIQGLASKPRPSTSKKIKGATNLWRIRCGEYRVIYHVFQREKVIDIVAVRHRREAYR